MGSMTHLRFYWLFRKDLITVANGGSAASSVKMVNKWSLPFAVGDWTWDNPGGAHTGRTPIFGAIKDPNASVLADWWHQASYDDALWGCEHHRKQFGPCPRHPRLRHVASGNEYFIASMISPHIPSMMPRLDTDVAGFFDLVTTAVNVAQSTATKMANGEIGDYIGYWDYKRNIEPLLGSTLELIESAS